MCVLWGLRVDKRWTFANFSTLLYVYDLSLWWSQSLYHVYTGSLTDPLPLSSAWQFPKRWAACWEPASCRDTAPGCAGCHHGSSVVWPGYCIAGRRSRVPAVPGTVRTPGIGWLAPPAGPRLRSYGYRGWCTQRRRSGRICRGKLSV